MNIKLILIALLLPAIIATSGLANVVINEVELDSPGEDPQWVELYNTGDDDVEITGWSITPMSDPTRETFIGFENISAKGFYVLTFVDGWLDKNKEPDQRRRATYNSFFTSSLVSSLNSSIIPIDLRDFEVFSDKLR